MCIPNSVGANSDFFDSNSEIKSVTNCVIVTVLLNSEYFTLTV